MLKRIYERRLRSKHSLRFSGEGEEAGCWSLRDCVRSVVVIERIDGSEYKGMLCAMKEWKRALSEYEQTALDREINIQKALRHPNCTRLYGVSRTDSGLPVLVMEKADGCLIDYTAKKKGPRLSNAEKCRIILEIAQGLEYIHSLNCVHRDIKVVVVEWSDV